MLDLNAEGLLKILGTQKPLHELSARCKVRLLLIGAWKETHDPHGQINVGNLPGW